MSIAAFDLEAEAYDRNGGEPGKASPPPCGCRDLLWGLLRDVFLVRELSRRANHHQLAAQVALDRAWLASESDHAFSLVWVCQHLGVSPAVVRAAYAAGAWVPGQWRCT
jgi:hypothetical protein